MTDEKKDTEPKRVTRPKAGKGDLQRRGGRDNYEKGHDRIFGWPVCNECGARFVFDPKEPFAFCECGISDWGDAGRPENYEERQREFMNGCI